MKALLSCLFLSFISLGIYSQSCLPQGILFSTQAQIDSFQVNYPGCTEITGSVTISGNDITDLSPLSVLCHLGSHFQINNNDSLLTLSGLDNISGIEGVLYIVYNDQLSDLSGLDAVTSIGGTLYIGENDSLTSLEGLNNLVFVGSDLVIQNNPVLASISALSNVPLINGSITLDHNVSLLSLQGFNGITSISGSLVVEWNIALINFEGLNALSTLGSFYVQWNSSLVDFSGLESLESIAGDFYIQRNYSLVDFSGLNALTYIGGLFLVRWDNALVNFNGLNNLQFINGYEGAIISNNDNLCTLAGLENLTNIHRNLSISHNPRLSNIEALLNVTSDFIGIWIYYNDSLVSLAGLDNFSDTSLIRFNVFDNNMLSDCAIESVCHLLADPGGYIEIHDNETGCNNAAEILDDCETLAVEESSANSQHSTVKIYPNPVNNIAAFSSAEITSVDIYDMLGTLISSRITDKVDMSAMKPGIYFVIGFDKLNYPLYKGKIVKN